MRLRIVLVLVLVMTATMAASDQLWTAILAARIAAYRSTREQAVAEVGGLTTSLDAAEVVGDSRDLASRITSLRREASEGDIFGPPVAGALRTVLAERLARPDGDLLLAQIAEVQPAFRVHVNGRYPGDAPLATTPAFVLDVLPSLPSTLAYRFVESDLVLLDRNTRVIVDVLRDALPRVRR